jgi:WD40 repeat protein
MPAAHLCQHLAMISVMVFWCNAGDRERIIVGTDGGELLVVDNGDVRGMLVVDNSCKIMAITVTPKVAFLFTAKHITKASSAVQTLIVHENVHLQQWPQKETNTSETRGWRPQGFAVGLSNGSVSLYEREQDEKFFKSIKLCVVEGQTQSVHSMAISLSEDSIMVSMSNNQLYGLNLITSEQVQPPQLVRFVRSYRSPQVRKGLHFVGFMKVSSCDTQMEEIQLKQVAHQLHSTEITGVDSCIRRPVVATCSLDRRVHLWNIKKRYFQDCDSCCSQIPSGHDIAVHAEPPISV